MFDQEVFNRFQSLQILTSFALDPAFLQAQKQAFLAGDIRNPRFIYNAVPTATDFRSQKEDLESLVKDISSHTAMLGPVKQLYYDRIESTLLLNQLHQASTENDNDTFFAYGQKLHGEINQSWWWELVANLDSFTKSQLDLSKLPQESQSRPSIGLSLKRSVANHIFALYPYLQEVGEWEHEIIDAALIQKACNTFLASLGLSGWQVIITNTSQASLSVIVRQKTIKIPSTRSMTVSKLQQILAHEIGTHVMRYHNGSQTKLLLLSLGLSRYLVAEEGLATLVAQSLSKFKWKNFAGDDLYLAIGLVVGLDGKKRDFRDLYEIMKVYYQQKRKTADPAKTEQKAWQLCLRLFRGTDGQAKGQCYLKDLAYYKGNRLMWDFYSQQPEFFPQLFKGKFSPFETEQMDCLRQLDIVH